MRYNHTPAGLFAVDVYNNIKSFVGGIVQQCKRCLLHIAFHISGKGIAVGFAVVVAIAVEHGVSRKKYIYFGSGFFILFKFGDFEGEGELSAIRAGKGAGAVYIAIVFIEMENAGIE